MLAILFEMLGTYNLAVWNPGHDISLYSGIQPGKSYQANLREGGDGAGLQINVGYQNRLFSIRYPQEIWNVKPSFYK